RRSGCREDSHRSRPPDVHAKAKPADAQEPPDVSSGEGTSDCGDLAARTEGGHGWHPDEPESGGMLRGNQRDLAAQVIGEADLFSRTHVNFSQWRSGAYGYGHWSGPAFRRRKPGEPRATEECPRPDGRLGRSPGAATQP